MSKTVTNFTAQLVTFHSTLPVADVLARLDNELNKNGSGEILFVLQNAKTKEEIVKKVENITSGGGGDFLYMSSSSHDTWLDTFFGGNSTPVTYLYTFGNPLVAQTILRHDLRAGLNIPPRLLVTQDADHSGTRVLYYLPSSMIQASENSELDEAVQILDKKIEKLVRRITGVES